MSYVDEQLDDIANDVGERVTKLAKDAQEYEILLKKLIKIIKTTQ
jgi:vacuolar-type H+-ATPase subunit E/Vma4